MTPKVKSDLEVIFKLVPQTHREVEYRRNSRRGTWYYGAAVGAQLPIISALRDMVKTGDTVHRVEAYGVSSASFGSPVLIKKY